MTQTKARVLKRLRVKPENTAGFTLVELLLAVVLMSILFGLAYGGLHAAGVSAQRGEILLVESGELRTAHQFVRRQLNQLLPLPYAVADDINPVRIVFDGDETHIQFVAPMPGYLGDGGPQVQLLELAGGSDDRVLQFSHALLQGFEQEDLHERDPIVLVEGVETASFEFLMAGINGDINTWVPSWNQREKLPLAVRLNLEFVQSERLRWPELVAGVRVDEQATTSNTGRRSYEQAIQDLINRNGQPSS